MITNVTITGADNSISPLHLLPISREFPFVEWGILVSRSHSLGLGTNRFPGQDWLESLYEFKRGEGKEMKLSCHLCGRWVREILLGTHDLVTDLTPQLWSIFDRVQLNTHGERHNFNEHAFEKLATYYPGKEFIIQYDNVNSNLVYLAQKYRVKHAALFDLSHGIGLLPSKWPDLLPNTHCGYAGGLSPQNLSHEIRRIEEKAGNKPIWIDMETHVRTDGDRQFSIPKVRDCLEISWKHIHEFTPV